jgi:hypothetical protein
MGYGTDYDPPARISSLIDEYAANAYNLIEPSYSYTIRDVERVQGSSVFVEGSIVFQSNVIARLLGRCHKVALLVVTIGDYLEEMVCWLSKHNLMLQAALLDSIGSDAVEGVTDFVQGRIEKLANEQGLVISRRFSPGYCDWDVREQKKIFRAVNGNLAGVHLTDGCLMVPQKSISGIIGISLASNDVDKYNPCKTCDKLDCHGRR